MADDSCATDAVSVLRINCGGNGFTDSGTGLAWSGDTGYLIGNFDDQTGAVTVAGAGTLGPLFQSNRWAQASPAVATNVYQINNVSAGVYTVKLYFANLFLGESRRVRTRGPTAAGGCTGTSTVGSRVFDVYLQNTLVRAGFDIVAVAGGDRTGMPPLPLSPLSSVFGPLRWLAHYCTVCAVMWSAATSISVSGVMLGGSLLVGFRSIQENPLISGIELLLEGNLPSTLRINCGGTALVDATMGVSWMDDTYFLAGAQLLSRSLPLVALCLPTLVHDRTQASRRTISPRSLE
jgi:hypothetical protein